MDIQEGAPPLKLPYNITEDPWFAAQQFLDRNELSQAFLDQVANFIIDNTKGVTLSTGDQGYTDPLTGSVETINYTLVDFSIHKLTGFCIC